MALWDNADLSEYELGVLAGSMSPGSAAAVLGRSQAWVINKRRELLDAEYEKAGQISDTGVRKILLRRGVVLKTRAQAQPSANAAPAYDPGGGPPFYDAPCGLPHASAGERPFPPADHKTLADCEAHRPTVAPEKAPSTKVALSHAKPARGRYGAPDGLGGASLAAWLVDHTDVAFDKIAKAAGIDLDQVQRIADGDPEPWRRSCR